MTLFKKKQMRVQLLLNLRQSYRIVNLKLIMTLCSLGRACISFLNLLMGVKIFTIGLIKQDLRLSFFLKNVSSCNKRENLKSYI